MLGRGELTPYVKAQMEKFLGRETSVAELRLIPYFQYCSVNAGHIDIRKVNDDDRRVLAMWRKEGHIEGGASQIRMTRRFWDFMSDVMFHAYFVRGDTDAVIVDVDDPDIASHLALKGAGLI